MESGSIEATWRRAEEEIERVHQAEATTERWTGVDTAGRAARAASLGDFEPQILVILGSPPRSRIWAVARLRNGSALQAGTSSGEATMSPRESFALAWHLLKLGLRAMM